MSRIKMPILSIALYLLGCLLVFYAAWGMLSSHKYITTMIEQNQLVVSGNMYDIANFYMSNSAQYFLFAVTLFTLGWMLQKNSFRKAVNLDTGKQVTSIKEILDAETDEDDFDKWYQNNDK